MLRSWFHRILSISIPIATLSLANFSKGITRDDYPTFSPDPTRFASTINNYLNNDGQAMPPENAIVAVGSSSIVGWHYRIESDLEGLTVIRRGFGGSQMSDAIYYAETIVTRYNPRAVILYEGDNDTQAGKSPETILSDFQFFVDLCRTTLPQLRIYVISIKPSISRWSIWDKMETANSLISNYADTDPNIIYIDVASALLENGVPKTNIFKSDNLHLNDAGYDLWSAACADIIIPAEIGYESSTDPNQSEPWGKDASDTAIQIDFGGSSIISGWNTITEPKLTGVKSPLVDTNNNPSGASLEIVKQFNGTNTSGHPNGADSTDGKFINEATTDTFYGNTIEFSSDTSPNPTIQLSNLYPNIEYNITLYASRLNVSDNRSGSYSISGDTIRTQDYDPANNTDEVISFNGIKTASDGTITLSISPAATNSNNYGFIYLGALIIEPLLNQTPDKSWGGYPVDQNNFVNTNDWIGWIKIYEQSAWVYSYTLSHHIYLPEPSTTGGWAYIGIKSEL